MAHPNMCPISFTYLPVASMWVITLHSLFLYSDMPLPGHPPSYWFRLFSSQTFSRINTPKFFKPSHSPYLPAYEDGTECSETLAYKIQMSGNYPEECIEQFFILILCIHGAKLLHKNFVLHYSCIAVLFHSQVPT